MSSGVSAVTKCDRPLRIHAASASWAASDTGTTRCRDPLPHTVIVPGSPRRSSRVSPHSSLTRSPLP